jgi:hypothetical protein
MTRVGIAQAIAAEPWFASVRSVRSGILLGLLQATFRTGPAHVVLLGTVTIEDRSQERPEPSRQSARKKRQSLLDFRQQGQDQ